MGESLPTMSGPAPGGHVAVIHGSLSADTEYIQQLSPDVRDVGVLHKGGASPIYVVMNGPATDSGSGCFTVLPGMRRWIPRASHGVGTEIHMIAAADCEWELEF